MVSAINSALCKTKEIRIRAGEIEKLAVLVSTLLSAIDFKKKCRIVLEHDPDTDTDVLEVFKED